MTVDASNVVITTITEDPATGDTVTTVDGVETSRIAPTATRVNERTLRAKATQAIADNIAFAATVAANRQRIIDATAGATTGTTATVTTVAQAQAAIRSIASTLVTTLNAELAIADQAAALSQQNVALLRLMLGELDSTDGT